MDKVQNSLKSPKVVKYDITPVEFFLKYLQCEHESLESNANIVNFMKLAESHNFDTFRNAWPKRKSILVLDFMSKCLNHGNFSKLTVDFIQVGGVF